MIIVSFCRSQPRFRADASICADTAKHGSSKGPRKSGPVEKDLAVGRASGGPPACIGKFAARRPLRSWRSDFSFRKADVCSGFEFERTF